MKSFQEGIYNYRSKNNPPRLKNSFLRYSYRVMDRPYWKRITARGFYAFSFDIEKVFEVSSQVGQSCYVSRLLETSSGIFPRSPSWSSFGFPRSVMIYGSARKQFPFKVRSERRSTISRYRYVSQRIPRISCFEDGLSRRQIRIFLGNGQTIGLPSTDITVSNRSVVDRYRWKVR